MIVDFRFTPPTPEGLPRYTAPPKHLQGYAQAFGTRVYGGENPDVRLMSVDELLAYLDRAGVDKALLKTGDNETTQGKKYPMDRLAEYIKGHEDRLIAVSGVDPYKGMAAVRELEWSVKELGFRGGVNLGPYELKLRANDKKFYPIYTKCVELGIPVLLHTSINFSNELLLDFGNPMYIDEVAVDFPELKIVCVHGGWPWPRWWPWPGATRTCSSRSAASVPGTSPCRARATSPCWCTATPSCKTRSSGARTGHRSRPRRASRVSGASLSRKR